MTNAELKDALLNKKPVIVTTNDGTVMHCRYVYGITYREHNGNISVSAEVLDGNGKCVYIADPKQIRYGV